MQSCRPIKIYGKVMFDEEKILTTYKKINAFANPIRLKIMALLWKHGELRVYEFEKALGLKQPTVSYHLALLIEGRIIKRRQCGPQSFYSIDNNAPEIPKLFILNDTFHGSDT